MTLGLFDILVLVVSVALAIYIGLRAKGKTSSLEAFLLGDRNLPWWAILGSIVATETSTATVLSLPGEGYGSTGMRFLQITFGFIIGRFVVVHLLLPSFFSGKLYSAYEVLQRRFGGWVKSVASLLFLVTRNLGDGLRLFLAALVLQKLVGWPFWWSALVIGGITIIYTYFGGMRSIVWNDCIQFVVYIAGGVVTIFVVVMNIPGGWAEFWEYSSTNNKLSVFQAWPSPVESKSFFHWLLSDPFSLWAGVIGGAFLSLGTHGTDQMMVQRYLSARSQRDAARALLLSGIVVFLQFALFLFIGVLLACFYSHHPETDFQRGDEVYAHFIIESFPKNTGLVGLMLAAILAAAMSTLSSSLNSSASAVINDFYLPRTKKEPDRAALLRLSRRLAIAFGILQMAIGVWAVTFDRSVVGNALTIAGYSAGLLLGVFALGVLTQKVQQVHALIGMLAGLFVLLFVQFGLPAVTEGVWQIAWPWYALIGSTTTFFVGATCSVISAR